MDATDNTEFPAYPQILGKDSLIQPFLIALSEKKSRIRARTVRALGQIGTEAVVTGRMMRS